MRNYMAKLCSFLFVVFFSCTLFHCKTVYAGNVSVVNYSTTNLLPTGAYKVTIASTPITVSQIYVCDTSGAIVKVASGTTNAAVDLFTAPVSGCALIPLNPYLAAGSQLNLAVASGSTVSTGANSISLLP